LVVSADGEVMHDQFTTEKTFTTYQVYHVYSRHSLNSDKCFTSIST
jgi:hypothetical protein